MAQTTPIKTPQQMALPLTRRAHCAEVSREDLRQAWRESQFGAMGYDFSAALSIPEFAGMLRLRAAARLNQKQGSSR